MGINYLLWDLEYPENIGRIIRTVHVLSKDSKIFIYDSQKYYEKRLEEIRRTSVATIDEIQPTIIEDLEAFLKGYAGRKIATTLSKNAVPLHNFRFINNDLVLLGNENTGLSDKVSKLCAASIIIPMFGKPFKLPQEYAVFKGENSLSLNVSIAQGIIAYFAELQLNDPDAFSTIGR